MAIVYPQNYNRIIKSLLHLVVLGLVLSAGNIVRAQDLSTGKSNLNPITLQQALQMAHRQNLDLRSAEADVNIAHSGYHMTRSVFLPQISVEETAVSTNDPLNVFGFKLKQEIVNNSDFNPSLLNNPDHFENFNTKVQVQQPLFNADGFLKRSAMKKRVKAAEAGYDRTRYYTDYQVKKSYFGLILARKNLNVIDSALVAAKQNEEQAQNYFNQGIINKADYLSARVRVLDLEQQKVQAEDQVGEQEDHLAYLIGMKDGNKPLPSDPLTMLPVETDITPDLQEVNSNRSDMLALQSQIDAYQKQLRASQFSYLPSLNLFGSYEWNDDVLMGNQGENYMVGATLKWNLFKGFQNAGAIQKTKAQLNKAKLSYQNQSEKNRIEIQKALRKLTQLQKQVDLVSQSREQAAENLKIRSDRYQQGMEKTTDLLNAEVNLSQAKLKYVQTIYQYNMTVFTLELLLEKPVTR